jgi:6-phosphogluconate dehydrogenase (decarboxylating)
VEHRNIEAVRYFWKTDAKSVVRSWGLALVEMAFAQTSGVTLFDHHV